MSQSLSSSDLKDAERAMRKIKRLGVCGLIVDRNLYAGFCRESVERAASLVKNGVALKGGGIPPHSPEEAIEQRLGDKLKFQGKRFLVLEEDMPESWKTAGGSLDRLLAEPDPEEADTDVASTD